VKTESLGTILVADDQKGVRKLLYEMFSREHFSVLLASDGCEAVKKIQEAQPDIVLLDVKMPGMDGLETLRTLQSLKQPAWVVLMTAYGEIEVIKEAMELGAVKHISKPFDVKELADMVLDLRQKQLAGKSPY